MTRAQHQVAQDDEDLYSYFTKSVSAVQAHADRFEQDYARPALKTSQVFFDEHPIAATFIAIFSLLSFLPIASFIGFSIFAVTSFTIIALTCAFLASVTVILAFLSILIFTLLVTLFSSIFLTGFAIITYSFVHLVVLVREHGRDGIWIWAEDINPFAFDIPPIDSSNHEHDGTEKFMEWSDSGHGSADGSDQEAPGGLAVEIKLEDSSSSSSPNQTSASEEVKAEPS